MFERKPRDHPVVVTAEDGEVLIEAPPHLVTSLTPETAEDLSNQLYECTAKARGQRILGIKAADGNSKSRR